MIEVKNIQKSFDGKTVLENLSFSVPKNGVLAIVGESGIGKTTLLRIIAGLEDADSGTIEIKETKTAYKFQEPRLFPWLTALENISEVIEEANRAEIAASYLEAVGLSHAAALYPDQLSGGMAQRVALARALAYNADLLLLDEPFSAVDETTKTALLSLVKQYGKEHAVILVTHDADEINALGASVMVLS